MKRIIGLPGEKLKIENGNVYIFDKMKNTYNKLNEDYLYKQNSTYIAGFSGIKIYEVPNDSFFLLGDNRNHSTDSRYCFLNCKYSGTSNFITKYNIIGKK